MNGRVPHDLSAHWSSESVIHQATGMIKVQIGAEIGAAFAVLSAHAYRLDRTIEEVSRDVVRGHLRFPLLDGDAASDPI